jgi:hypothetical protein
MQNEDRAMQQNQEHAVSESLRSQHILEHIEKQLRRSHEPTHDDFKSIIESVLEIPEAYRTIGLTTIAQHFVNGMELHLLALMATFQGSAEQEGISMKERQTTLKDVLPEAFQTLEILSKQVSVRSLDELAALNNITIALYTISRADTAEEAQKWLYELPRTYSRRLRQAGLLLDAQLSSPETKNQSMGQNNQFVNWKSYPQGKSPDVQEIGNTGIAVSTSVPPLSEPVSVPIETSDPNLAA